MLVEAPILDGDEGLGQIGRQIGEPHGGPARVATVGKQAAIRSEDLDIRRAFWHGELIDRRQLAGVIGEQAANPDRAPNAEHEGPVDEAAQERASAAARALFFRFAAARRAIFGIGAKAGIGVLRALKTRLDTPVRPFTPLSEHALDATRGAIPDWPCLLKFKAGGLRARKM